MNYTRTTYTAIVGTKARNGDVCLENLRENGEIIRGHVWLRRNKAGAGIDAIRALNYFNKVQFTAVAEDYEKTDERTGKKYFQLGLLDLQDVNRL
jgi:hypothetical protein